MSDIRNPKFLSVGDICRPVDSGKMLVQDCEVESPLSPVSLALPVFISLWRDWGFCLRLT